MPEHKKMFFNFDLARAEWVVCAYYSRDGNMISILESGRDIHIATGNLISGVPDDIVRKESKHVGNESNPEVIEDIRRSHIPELFNEDWFIPRLMSIRQMGKKSNHGLNLDEGPERFAQEYEMDYSEARRIYAGYHAAYPGIQNTFHKGVQEQLRKDRTLINCWREKRRFLDAWSRDLFKEAYAFIPQSTVVHITDSAMIAVYEDPTLQDVELMQEVHDNLLAQIPIANWAKVAAAVRRVAAHMTQACTYWGRTFTIGVDLKMGFDLSNMVEVHLTQDAGKLATSLKNAHAELVSGKEKRRNKA